MASGTGSSPPPAYEEQVLEGEDAFEIPCLQSHDHLRLRRWTRATEYGATPPAISAPGSRVMTIGLTVMLVSVNSAMHLGAGSFGLLLCFGGVLVGTSLVTAGVRMVDGPVPDPIVQVVSGGARALATFIRRSATIVGLVMASCAITAVSGEEDPVLYFGLFCLLLLGLTFLNIGARGE